MRITNRKNESAESLIRQAKRNMVSNLELFKNDEDGVFKEFKKKNPLLLRTIVNYTTIFKKLQKKENDGLLEEFSAVSKKLISCFNFTETTQDYNFLSDNFIDVFNSPLYIAMESIFDASLFKEQGKQRLFTNVYNLQRTVEKVSEIEYMFYVKPYVYHVNTITGEILRRTVKYLEFNGFTNNNYLGHVLLNDEVLYHNCQLVDGYWEDATYYKQSGDKGTGTIYKYINFTTVESSEEHGGKSFYMPAHQIIVLCWYGLNVLKYCLGSGSILTIDHMDQDAVNNSILNLGILTRVGNVQKAKKGLKAINFVQFFEVCGYYSHFNYKYYN